MRQFQRNNKRINNSGIAAAAATSSKCKNTVIVPSRELRRPPNNGNDDACTFILTFTHSLAQFTLFESINKWSTLKIHLNLMFKIKP